MAASAGRGSPPIIIVAPSILSTIFPLVKIGHFVFRHTAERGLYPLNLSIPPKLSRVHLPKVRGPKPPTHCRLVRFFNDAPDVTGATAFPDATAFVMLSGGSMSFIRPWTASLPFFM